MTWMMTMCTEPNTYFYALVSNLIVIASNFASIRDISQNGENLPANISDQFSSNRMTSIPTSFNLALHSTHPIQIKATSAILTDFLNSDVNGVTDWVRVSQSVDQDGVAFSTLIPQLIEKAKQPLGSMTKATPIKLLVGLPVYATSSMHSWFQSSQTSVTNPFSHFYMWTDVAPKTPQEQRYFAYDNVRRAYYRHVHGNPNSPLLNLTNADVQQEMIKVIEFWKQKLQIQGLMIINSTNVLPEFIPAIRQIMTNVSNTEFVWFADDPVADQSINPGDKVCYFEVSINIRVPTRTIDLTGQIATSMNDTRLTKCSPIWKVNQFSEDNKDFGTVEKLAYFLPGSFLMMAGQEVDLTTGTTELIKWSFKNYLDYTTYWPQNMMLPQTGLQRLQDWKTYASKALTVSLLGTAPSSNRFSFVNPPGSDNLFVAYREYVASRDRVYFVVSFQTLNTIVYFRTIFWDLSSPKMEVAYDSKDVYKGRLQLGAETLVNNEVLLLYYY